MKIKPPKYKPKDTPLRRRMQKLYREVVAYAKAKNIIVFIKK